MWDFVLGFGVASALWFFGILNAAKVKDWYAKIKASI